MRRERLRERAWDASLGLRIRARDNKEQWVSDCVNTSVNASLAERQMVVTSGALPNALHSSLGVGGRVYGWLL